LSIKVCVVDDHKLLREGLKQVLHNTGDIVVTDEASTGKEFLGMLGKKKWDVVLLDISLEDMSGIDVLREIRTKNKNLPVLMVTMHYEDQYGLRVLKLGASGYISKRDASTDLIAAIKKVVTGDRYITPKLASLLSDNFINDTNQSIDALSNREFEVFKLIGSGKSINDISYQLGVSNKTVSTYRGRISEKMGLESTAEIIRFCIQEKIVL